MSETFTVRPIGIITTPWATIEACPRNGRQPDPPPLCRVRVFPEYVEGLRDIEGFSHLILLYWMDRARSPRMLFKPPFAEEEHGLFTTRSPARPNPIGLSVVALAGMEGRDCLKVRYLDCVDGTRLLDIKPYLPSTDAEPGARMGWLAAHRTARKG
jgi:tRNA-Thr(GGU) m(6)t(6)A37 methyltransferase TsaA